MLCKCSPIGRLSELVFRFGSVHLQSCHRLYVVFFQVLVSSSSHLSRKETTEAIAEITAMNPTSTTLSQVNKQVSCSCLKLLCDLASLTASYVASKQRVHTPTTTLCTTRPAVVSSNVVCIVAEWVGFVSTSVALLTRFQDCTQDAV